ncbi:MAG TPA: hypothetical protein VF004_03690 [Burkholderiales bacterium]
MAAVLERRGFGVEALQIVDNFLRHGPPAPRATPPLVLDLLARPLAGVDAAAIFRASVPASLLALESGSAQRPVDELIETYIAELAQAQRLLRDAVKPFELDAVTLRLPSPRQLSGVADAVDAAQLERANHAFIEATVRFATGLRVTRDNLSAPRTFQSPIGEIVIGSRGNDRHGPNAALIVDPGGDDVYERAPARYGAISVIVDLAGNDEYHGSDIALGAFSALIDLAGNDRYVMQASGLAAAIAGASLLLDFAGDDTYEAKFFGQGAAALGVGALLDFGGDDRYRLEAWGQGLGMAGGLGLLWDRAGNDRYALGGVPDPYARGAGLSGGQGVGLGHRDSIAGGTGILRDDAGADQYEAQMFAQGSGYYYGIGLLWDGAGADRYQAFRYAQGNGTHQAVGVLRDEDGDDHYAANAYAQGMGLDVAVGVLIDAGGDDHYVAQALAQGSATANGFGLLADNAGADRFDLRHPEYGWASAEWRRGLPSVGVLLHGASAQFARAGEPTPVPAQNPPVTVEAPSAERCPSDEPGEAVVCRVRDAPAAELELVWAELAALLKNDPATPLAGWIAISLAKRPPSVLRAEEVAALIANRESCHARALGLRAWPTLAAARAGLRSRCFRLQAAARAAYERLGEPLPPDAALPMFLRAIPPQEDTF